MLHFFEALPELNDGSYLSASYMRALVARSNWLFNSGHGLEPLPSQPESSNYTRPLWEGSATQRSEHSTLKFSARINLNSGATAYLQYLRSDGNWITLLSDSATGLRFFGGSTWNNVSLSGSTPKDGVWHFRFYIPHPGGWGQVYGAYLTGTGGFPSWPSLPSFNTGQVLYASQLNALRQAQEYLFACAKRNITAVPCGEFWHTQYDSYQALARYVFRYDGRRRLYLYLQVSGLPSGQHVYVYLEPFSYNQAAGDSRIATLYDITSDGSYSLNFDMANYSLAKGEYYAVEVTACYGAHVKVGNVVMADVGTITRTYVPKADWAHGDIPTAAQLNTIANDINQLYNAADRETPLFADHPVVSHHFPDNDGMFYWQARYFRMVHKWRWLRWRGSGLLATPDMAYTLALSGDKTDPLRIQTLDLDSVSWLKYGMEYIVADNGDDVVYVAFEEYEA